MAGPLDGLLAAIRARMPQEETPAGNNLITLNPMYQYPNPKAGQPEVGSEHYDPFHDPLVQRDSHYSMPTVFIHPEQREAVRHLMSQGVQNPWNADNPGDIELPNPSGQRDPRLRR